MIEDLKSTKQCKDCGKPAYSFRIGWEDNEGIVNWHFPRHYNQCKNCRAKMYKLITKKRSQKRRGEGK